jgi:hypothetical protein
MQWSERQPEAAVQWLEHIPSDIRDPVQQELAGAVLARRPQQAILLLSALPQDNLTDRMLRQAAMEYATTDPSNAMSWARRQPDSETRALLLGAVLCAQAEYQPVEAAKGLYDLPEGPEQELVLVEVIQRWAQHNPVQAAVFVADVSGTVGISATENLMIAWALQDRDASKEWAAERADPLIRKAATTAWNRATAQFSGLQE